MTEFSLDAGDGPRTHAFIMGVGDYPNVQKPLPGFPSELAQLADRLVSASVSAIAFAEWLVSAPLTVPLGTIELLLSDPRQTQATYRGIAIDRATLPNIMASYAAWEQRCSKDANNVAMVFYCGHGLSKETSVLLAEDFGSFPGNWYHHSIDAPGLVTGMMNCAARTQYFFFDACQQVPRDALLTLGDIKGTHLSPANARGLGERLTAAKYTSSIPGHKAWARAKKETQFTKALLQSLDADAAEFQNGHWVVTADNLSKILAGKMDRLTRLDNGMEQLVGRHVEGRNATLVDLGVDIDVPMVLACRPEQLHARATLSVQNADDPTYQRSRQPARAPWKLRLPPAIYRFNVELAQGAGRGSRHISVEPPGRPEFVEVQP